MRNEEAQDGNLLLLFSTNAIELMPGIAASFSIRSAKTRKAKARARAPACNSVAP